MLLVRTIMFDSVKLCGLFFFNDLFIYLFLFRCVVFLIWRLVSSNYGIEYWIISFFDNISFIFLWFPFLKFQIIRSNTSWIVLSHLLIFSLLLSISFIFMVFLWNSLNLFVKFFQWLYSRFPRVLFQLFDKLFYMLSYPYLLMQQHVPWVSCVCCGLPGFSVTRSFFWGYWVYPKKNFTISSFGEYLHGHRHSQVKW